jgi:glycosyltransferase involved in cell wall biosynthesis
MRILRSIRSVNPEGGGPIEGIKQVSRIHQESGHHVEVVSLDAPNDDWVREFPLKVNALGPVRDKFGYTPELVPWLKSHAKDYDAVIVNGLWQYHSFGVLRAFRNSTTPYFVFPHGMLDPWFKRTYPMKHLKKWLYWPWAEYRVLRKAKAVCFTSEEERRRARESFWPYRCHEEVVAYGTSAPTGEPEQLKRLFLQRFQEVQGKRVLLYLGRLHPKKGCDLLLRAFARILKRSAHSSPSISPTTMPRPLQNEINGHNSQPLHLVMAGPDQHGWLAQLQALAFSLGISDRITWTGMLKGDLKPGAFYSAEAFVLPSHQENFGIAVAEAMACGVPALISNKVNIWREVQEDRAGLVENDDEEGALKMLERWISLSPDEQAAYRAQARKCFADRFEIHRAAQSIIRLLNG